MTGKFEGKEEGDDDKEKGVDDDVDSDDADKNEEDKKQGDTQQLD